MSEEKAPHNHSTPKQNCDSKSKLNPRAKSFIPINSCKKNTFHNLDDCPSSISSLASRTILCELKTPSVMSNVNSMTELPKLNMSIDTLDRSDFYSNLDLLSISSPPIINDVSTPIISDISSISSSDLTNNSENRFEYLGNTHSTSERTSETSLPTNVLNPNAPIFHPLGVDSVSINEFSDIISDSQNNFDPKSMLYQLKEKNADRPVIGQLNINSIAPKFEPHCFTY